MKRPSASALPPDPSMPRTYPARGINGRSIMVETEPPTPSAPSRWTGFRIPPVQDPMIAVRPGDQVQLVWWGDSGVPQWCSQAWAVVIACNRKRIVVHPVHAVDGFTLSVLPIRHVVAYRPID